MPRHHSEKMSKKKKKKKNEVSENKRKKKKYYCCNICLSESKKPSEPDLLEGEIMSNQGGGELKCSIRKLDYPHCATDALTRIEQFCSSSLMMGRAPSGALMELSAEIMAEFIFCEVDRRGTPTNKRSEFQQLLLLDVLCNYFGYNSSNNVVASNSVFMSLFPAARQDRLRILYKLVSMAISLKNIPVLTATGIWMQQLGCTSKPSLELAQELVTDFFILLPRSLGCWKDLPTLAPQFTANFLTTVGEMYGTDKEHDFTLPPDTLLEIVTQWISDNPTLCLSALLIDLKLVMPMGAIPMAAITPFAGLFRWCVLIPLHYALVKNVNPADNDSASREKNFQLYARLHLALLESLLECHIVPTRESVLSAQHMSSIVEPIMPMVGAYIDADDEQKQREMEAVTDAVNRFGQAVQISLSVNCVYGNKGELFQQMGRLKDNSLIQLVLQAQGMQHIMESSG